MNRILFIVRGLPGSGKSTLAKAIADEVFEADDYFTDASGCYRFVAGDLPLAHSDCYARTEAALIKRTQRVAVANTFTREWELAPYLDLAKNYGYVAHVIVVEGRHGRGSIHSVPLSVTEAMKSRFEISL